MTPRGDPNGNSYQAVRQMLCVSVQTNLIGVRRCIDQVLIRDQKSLSVIRGGGP